MKKLFLIIVVAVLSQPVLFADNFDGHNQDGITPVPQKHEITMNFLELGGAQMAYTGSWDVPTSAFSAGIGANYTYWFSHPFGFTTGLRFVYFRQHEKSNGKEYYTNGPLDIYSGNIQRTIDVNLSVKDVDASEHITIGFVEIPLQLAYHYRNFYGHLGLSVMMPFSVYGTYSYNVAQYEITRLNDLSVDLDPTLDYTVVQRVSDEFEPEELNRVYLLLSAEIGYRFTLNNKNAIALSLYGRFDPTEHQLSIDPRRIFNLNRGVVTAQGPMDSGLVPSYNFWTAGLRVSYILGVK